MQRGAGRCKDRIPFYSQRLPGQDAACRQAVLLHGSGDNRYHSIFGAVKACIAVNPSGTAPALVALNAKIKTNKRIMDSEKFWDMAVPGSNVLEADEIVTDLAASAVQNSPQQTLREIADQNAMSPDKVYEAIRIFHEP